VCRSLTPRARAQCFCFVCDVPASVCKKWSGTGAAAAAQAARAGPASLPPIAPFVSSRGTNCAHAAAPGGRSLDHCDAENTAPWQRRRRDAALASKAAAPAQAAAPQPVRARERDGDALGRTRAGVAEQQVKAAAARGFEDLVALMRTKRAHAGVQAAACQALINRLRASSSRVNARDAGAVDEVVAAMCAHRGNALVQRKACRALRFLCPSADASRVTTGDGRLIEAVVAAQHAHGDSAAVQVAACRALVTLCFPSSNETKAGDAGAIKALVAALLAHGDIAAVQKYACWALAHICWTRYSELCARARVCGAVIALQAALARFPAGDVAVHAKKALEKITAA
jgi:hypothetical protein